MEFFRQWVLCVCISLICASVFSLLIPSGRLKTFYRVMLSVFVFTSFLYPFKDIKEGKIDFNMSEISVSESAADKAYEREIEKQICSALEENGITGVNAETDIEVNYETGCAEIKQVRLFVSTDNDCEEVRRLVLEKLGINAEVKTIGA